ncbi:hypothetical protein P308_09485 [Pseudomonas piscis]|nr:hypothetical protein P308_09575 [Pseudomonas piscis]ERO61399.1 hypothetical protein P308_09485 [Pseudomonas piscis]
MVGEHAAGAEAVEKDRPRVAAPFMLDELMGQFHPGVIAHLGAWGDPGLAVSRHVDRYRFQPLPRQGQADDGRHLPTIGPDPMEQDDLGRCCRIDEPVQVHLMPTPWPILLLRGIFSVDAIGRGEEGLDVLPLGLVLVAHCRSRSGRGRWSAW